MFRSILLVIWVYCWGIFLGLLTIPCLLLPRGVIMFFIRFYTRTILLGLRIFSGIRVVFRGQQHIPEGQVLVAGKHQSMLDVFVPFLMFRDPMIVMKRELLWYPVLGWCALRTGMLPIDRDGGSKTMKSMLKAAARRMPAGKGRQMIIFPEGSRRAPAAPPDYKPAGVRAFYKALNVPLLPVATNAGLCWPARGIRRRSGIIVYEVLPPLGAGQNPKRVLSELEQSLEAACDRLLQEGLAVQGRSHSELS